jgi:hypothetical protein
MERTRLRTADVRVIQCRGSSRFPAEAFQDLRVARDNSGGRNLRATKRAELGVFGLENYSHAATAKLFENLVVRDGLADHLAIGTSLVRIILRTRHKAVNEAGEQYPIEGNRYTYPRLPIVGPGRRLTIGFAVTNLRKGAGFTGRGGIAVL